MSLGFENLLVALLFLLPGFLTSKLISARTPAFGKEASAFQDTFESLLRSVYIHLFIAPFFFTFVWFFLARNDTHLLNRIQKYGLQAYYLARPLDVAILLFGWLFVAFCLAVIFGYKWDPLDALFSRLVNRTGTKSEDLFYQLREYAIERRRKGLKDNQLWMQERLKNGCVYQGEFSFVGYRHDGMSRELMLTNVTFIPCPTQELRESYNIPKRINFVYIELSNCESIEVLFGGDISSNKKVG